MQPIILFRKQSKNDEEFEIAQNYFDITESRIGIENKLVIPRYSALPFYKELEHDVNLQKSQLINSYEQHKYIANFEYYEDVKDYTPKTYFSLDEVNNNGPFIIKGRTNSRKQQFKEKMFAQDKQDLIPKYLDLMNDPLIQEQGVIIRDFIPLENFGTGINGLDFANEWRFFFYQEKLLSFGYYWSSGNVILDNTQIDKKAIELAYEIANKVKDKVNFFVVDVAKTKEGKWILIELNDGQMSGLSETNPNELYSNLLKALTK